MVPAPLMLLSLTVVINRTPTDNNIAVPSYRFYFIFIKILNNPNLKTKNRRKSQKSL